MFRIFRNIPILGVCALALLVSSCHSLRFGHSGPGAGADTYAVLINGGGRPRINFQSHLANVKGFVDVLESYGVPRENIVIFSADGANPKADLAVRETHDDEDFWILPRRAQRALRPQIEYIDSVVDGYQLHPATRAAIEKWFVEHASRLDDGDTLFLYVTDHGEINKDDLTNNSIVLWKEELSVNELRELLGYVPSGVRTVMLMSQCFSGSFASLADPERNICGYYASSANRPAYGCYPENRGVDGVGHSYHFLRAIDHLGSLASAEQQVLVFDDSPDVPHASSDVYLRHLLDAAVGDRELDHVIDEYLDRAWRDKAKWEPDIRLLDRIGRAYGIFSPRSLEELDQQIAVLPKVSRQLSSYASRWNAALDSVRQQNLDDFLAAHPDWKDRLAPENLREIDAQERAALGRELVAVLAPFGRKNTARLARMETLRRRAENAEAAAYRMEVRLGVLLRMRNQLTSVAGRAYLQEVGNETQKNEYAALRACENLQLARVESDDSADTTFAALAAGDEDPQPFPRLADDQELVDEVMPAWMGIRYQPPSDTERKEDGRSPGAVTVVTVFPKSAAAKAGLTVGDVIIGPPGSPFREPNQVREWTMQREIGEPAELVIERDGVRRNLTLLPDPFPIEMPKLPGPPKVGGSAPDIDVVRYRGDVRVRTGRDTLLFFWATWCVPCKFALPEIMRIAEERGIDVIAITDEKAETLDSFFQSFQSPFPANVAIDRYRQSFQTFGVSGTPTFVFIDASGVVRYYETGFNAKVGLVLPSTVGKAGR